MIVARTRHLFIALAMLAGLLAGAGSARAVNYSFNYTGVTPTSGNPIDVSGLIVFTPGTGALVVSLTNNHLNDVTAGQLISGIGITFSGNAGTPTGLVQSGQLVNTATNTLVSGSPTHWKTTIDLGLNNKVIWLSTAGTQCACGAPSNMITGPTNNGYASANTSIKNRDPNIAGTGTFSFNLTGFAANMTITSLTMLFGTAPGTGDDLSIPLTNIKVPEPASMVLFGVGLAGLAAVRRRVKG